MRKNKPRIHITVNSVRALPPSPPNEKTFDWDDEVRGFGCYRTSCGDVDVIEAVTAHHMPLLHTARRAISKQRLGAGSTPCGKEDRRQA